MRNVLQRSNRASQAAACWIVLCIYTAGCGSDGPEVVEVTGRITKGGQPVSNVVVQFYPEKGRPSAGRTDDDGRYELEFSEEIPKGALPGVHKVSLQVLQERIDEAVNLKDPKYHAEMPEILQHFGNWDTTKLKIEVRSDQTVIDIELDDYL